MSAFSGLPDATLGSECAEELPFRPLRRCLLERTNPRRCLWPRLAVLGPTLTGHPRSYASLKADILERAFQKHTRLLIHFFSRDKTNYLFTREPDPPYQLPVPRIIADTIKVRVHANLQQSRFVCRNSLQQCAQRLVLHARRNVRVCQLPKVRVRAFQQISQLLSRE